MTVPCGVAVLVVRTVSKELEIDCPSATLEYRAPEILLLKRKGAHGAGTWALPGGRIEPNEKPLGTATRELLEETGLSVLPFPFDAVPYNSTIAGGEPWVTIFFMAVVSEDAQPEIKEPEKCEEMRWFCWTDMPSPLFEPLADLVREVNRRLAAKIARLGA